MPSNIINDIFDDMAYGFGYFPPQRTNYTFSGQIVDTSKFDVVPKLEYRQELLKIKEEEIEALDRQYESEESYYKEKRKKLVEEKEKHRISLKTEK